MRSLGSCSPRTVRALRLAALVGAALAVAACSRSRADREPAIADDLQHDLVLASSSGIELAGAPRHAVQVVSAIERGPRAAPVRATRAPTPRASGRRRHAPSPKAEEPAPSPAPEIVESATTVAAAGDAAEAPAPASEPEVEQPAPAPAPVPEGNGGGAETGRRGGGWGTAIGTVVGVVIRGAVVGGVDHCDERTRRGRNGGIASLPIPLPEGVNPRFPATGSTFPRY